MTTQWPTVSSCTEGKRARNPNSAPPMVASALGGRSNVGWQHHSPQCPPPPKATHFLIPPIPQLDALVLATSSLLLLYRPSPITNLPP
mmetsp:Transcript_30538/g.57813  ORF Transcript_30538/g.57813 Transcript_30538/m.57813 type:complete len:88 (-) Transcript_30538:322-585(-)